MGVLSELVEKRVLNKKSFAILIDPDFASEAHLQKLVDYIQRSPVDYVFVGGSLISGNHFEYVIDFIKKNTSKTIVLFPGNYFHLQEKADSLLLLSLVSGRNPELLIGQHIAAASLLKNSKVEIISTAYLLIDGGKATTVSYISNTQPIPADKPTIAAATAYASELIGMKIVFLDAGSGAKNPVSTDMISQVKASTSLPIIVGGGIKSLSQIKEAWQAGADLVVVGEAFEQNNFISF